MKKTLFSIIFILLISLSSVSAATYVIEHKPSGESRTYVAYQKDTLRETMKELHQKKIQRNLVLDKFWT